MARASLAVLTLAGTAAIHTASAQVVSENLFTATVSQGFLVDDNLGLDAESDGTTSIAETGISFGILRESDTQSLSMSLGTQFQSLWLPEEGYEFQAATPTNATMAYSLEGLDTAFDSNFRLRQRSVKFRVDEGDSFFGEDPDPELDPEIDPDNETGDTRELLFQGDIGLEIGTTSPSTYEFRLSGTSFNYSDEEATSRVARRDIEGEAIWTLRLTPVLGTSLRGSYSYFSADNPAETEIREAEIDAGFVYEPDETLIIRTGLGFADRERKQLVGGSRETVQSDSGPIFRTNARYVLPNLVVVADAQVSAAAPETRFNGNLRGVYTLPRGRIFGRVFQRTAGSSGGQEERTTGAGIGLVHDLNRLSRVELDFAMSQQTNLDNDDDSDITRSDLTASYEYDLTDTITSEVGYRFRQRDTDETATSHRVFFNIARDFETGF